MKRLILGAKYALWLCFSVNAQGYSVISVENLLSEDPEEKARAAVDEGNRTLIMPLSCDRKLFDATDEMSPDWLSSSYVFPDPDCPELLEHPELSGRMEDIKKTILTYNMAVVERMRERGQFSIYGGGEVIENGGIAYDIWRMIGAANLMQVAGRQPVGMIQSHVFGAPGYWPVRLYVTGHLSVDAMKRNLDTSVWKPSPFPWELLEAMHWYVGEEDACFLGNVNGYPAYLLLRKDYDLAVLVVALTLRESAESESLKR